MHVTILCDDFFLIFIKSEAEVGLVEPAWLWESWGTKQKRDWERSSWVVSCNHHQLSVQMGRMSISRGIGGECLSITSRNVALPRYLYMPTSDWVRQLRQMSVIATEPVRHLQIQIQEYRYTNTNTHTRIQIHKNKYTYTNTNTQIQINEYIDTQIFRPVTEWGN